MIRILSRIRSEPWAVTREVMDTIMQIAQRENMSPESVAQQLGRKLENTYDVEMREGVAILHVQGPLFRYANLFTELSGATSYDMLARDFARAVDDPAVRAVLLNIDSPGGEANGVSEFADQVYAARGAKPIVAYVGGMGASAAYWLASAADEIVIGDTAILGSIGTVMTVTDTRDRDRKAGVKQYEVVSSQSPYKRVDPATDTGMSRMQALVDSLSDVFIEKVAQYRGYATDDVLNDFGQGGVLVGQAAVDAGLADRLGSFEATFSELRSRTSGAGTIVAARSGENQEVDMTIKTGAHGAETSKIKAEQQALEAKAKAAAKDEDDADAEEDEEEEDTSTRKSKSKAKAKAKAKGKAKSEDEDEDADAEGDDDDMDAEDDEDDTSAKSSAFERKRINSILNSDEAQGRAELANHLAFSTSMGTKEALGILAKSPQGSKSNGFNQFDQAMRQQGNPNVGADTDASQNETTAALERSIALGKQYGIQ